MNDTICSSANFPFSFFAANGSTVDGMLDADGSCIFPTAACSNANSVVECCIAKDSVSKTGSNYMFIAFAIIFIPLFWFKTNKSPEERAAHEEREQKQVPFWMRDYAPNFLIKLFKYGLMAYIGAQVVIPIFMRDSIQRQLSVGERNAVIAAEAFLVPYRDIFQFVEDIVLVRVNYAMGAGNKPLTNQLVHLGIVAAVMVGVTASILATILGVIPPALEALTRPGLANDIQLYPGCDLITDDTNVQHYWLLESWTIPFVQMGMVMSGYMLGALELNTLGWLGGLALSAIPLIWFLAVNQSNNKLMLLATAEFMGALLLPLLAIAYLISPLGREVRERTGVQLEWKLLISSLSDWKSDVNAKPGEGDVEAEKEPVNSGPQGQEHESTTQLLKDGLQIMFMDVAIQFCLSLGIYLALVNDAADGYKLTALQSALPTYGIAYALGLGIMFKVVGPQLIAAGKYKTFVTLARLTVGCALLLVPLIIGSVVPFRTEMAFNYGSNACSYAKNEECVPFFDHVFGQNAMGGQFTLPFTFDAFAIGASIEAVFFVLRATLLALIDLKFMLWSTVAALIAYVPAIIIASLVQPFAGHAIAYFVAMYIPQLVLIILFGGRLFVLLGRLSKQDVPASSKRSLKSASLRYMQ